MKNVLICLALLLVSMPAFAQKKVAVVKLLRGEVDVVNLGKTVRLKVEDWVEDGSVVKTAEKSFVKLTFLDKSQMNIGPNSEMRIEKFEDKDSGVIDLVKGKIRSQVSKDYLQIQNKDKSKLFIKTSNAVLGVRGTDFMVSTNGINTATVLFEGEVVFNKIEASTGEMTTEKLEQIVDNGVRILPGEFSVMDGAGSTPTVPSLLNVGQLEKLEKNDNFETERSPGSDNTTESKSVVPPGLTGQAVSNTAETLKSEVALATPSPTNASPVETVVASPAVAAANAKNAEGFSNGEVVKPANGSFVHIESGVVIPPGPGSILDPNTNTFIPNQSGKIAADGSYIPPKNVEITSDGKILVAVTDAASGTVKVQEVPKPSPVFANTGTSLAKTGESFAANPVAINQPAAAPANDILNANFVPSGLSDLSNNQRNQSGGILDVGQAVDSGTSSETTIVVH